MFKSTKGLCSHSLLAASLNSDVDDFIAHYMKTKDTINYAALGQHGLPTGGKKPSSQRRASSKKATSALKSILAAADDIRRMKWANKDPVASPSTGDQSSFLSVSTAQDQGNFQSAVYGVMANTVNFSTPVPLPPPPLPPPPPPPPSLLHLSPELVMAILLDPNYLCDSHMVHPVSTLLHLTHLWDSLFVWCSWMHEYRHVKVAEVE